MTCVARVLALVAALLWAITSAGAQERVRKSIDDLTADELESYAHAVMKIRDKSLDDPFVDYSYAHLAGIHNFPPLFDGACMHWRYEFLAWHRAHLINYEDALRAIDPPRTSNVTIPYWDWTKKPTGKRYPVAFENDAAAAAAHYGRPIDAALLAVLSNPRRTAAPSDPFYPWSEIAGIAVVGTGEFFGPSNDHGAIENPPHDTMHGFIGGDLLSTGTAADDVIFWSFHNFIDLVWWWRQQTITDVVPCQTCTLRGMPAQTALGNPGPTQVKDAIDAKVQLNYTYQFTPDEVVVAAAEAGPKTFSRRLPVLAALALNPPTTLRQFEVEMPSNAEGSLILAIERAVVPANLAYTGFVYLHPASVEFDSASAEFRDSYLVGNIAQFADSHLAHGTEHAGREFRIPIDLAAYPAIQAAPGEPLTASVAIQVSGSAPATGAAAAAADAMSTAVIEQNTAIGSATLRTP